jgi:Rieske 2Fe-2S family protein
MTVTAPVTATRFLLPPEAYFSTEWWEREQAQLFERTWTFVGPVSDVPDDGRPLVVPVGGTAVLVRRDATGGLRADGVEGRVAVCGVWRGFFFVHAEPAVAPALRDWLGDLPDLIGAFRPEELVEVAHVRFDVAANWKLYVENHIDVYHLWYLHERSLAAYDHPRHRWDDCAPHWSFYEPPRAGVADDAQFVRGFPPIRHIGEDDWGSGAHLVFPNLPFATGAGFFMTYQCIPMGPERTIIDLRVRAEPGEDHDVDAFVAMVGQVLHGEDGAACEQIQRALRSPAFEVGPLAGALEAPIQRFHEHYLAAMRP